MQGSEPRKRKVIVIAQTLFGRVTEIQVVGSMEKAKKIINGHQKMKRPDERAMIKRLNNFEIVRIELQNSQGLVIKRTWF